MRHTVSLPRSLPVSAVPGLIRPLTTHSSATVVVNYETDIIINKYKFSMVFCTFI